MSVNWEGYDHFDTGLASHVRFATNKEARDLFQRTMDTKHERVDALRKLLANNGVRLDVDDDALHTLYQWFLDNVEVTREDFWSVGDPWDSVIHDVGVFFGDLLVSRHPTLRWDLHARGPKHALYQLPVVTGFARVSKDGHFADVTRVMVGSAHRVVAGKEEEPDRLVKILSHVEQLV